MRPLIVLAAGGTGGHLFPAQALGEVLIQRGCRIHLMTDERVRDYGRSFPAEDTHIVKSASPGMSDPLRLVSRLGTLYLGYRQAKIILQKIKPAAVIGFGGYPSFPPIFASTSMHIPTIVHEANAVLGRANKFLAARVDRVAGSFATMNGLPAAALEKYVVTGNPVRKIVVEQRAATYPKFGKKYNLLVFGGSQGAKFFSDFMPTVIELLPEALRNSLVITQQCRPEDMDRVRARYQLLNVQCDLQPFFLDMPKRIALSHVVMCRSGASTIAELGVIGRPAIMVPLPHAIDNDQLWNAQSFADAGAGWVCPQAELKPHEFAAFLARLLAHHAELERAAKCALNHGQPDAAELLADLVDKIMKPEN